MIEICSFLVGLGFSLLVHFKAIRPSPHPPVRKVLYFLVSTIGITGMLWLSGVLIANFLREQGLL